MPPDFPARIVCLSDETTETLYLLGEQDRVVGVSGFSTRPPEVRTKPRVSTFTSANVDELPVPFVLQIGLSGNLTFEPGHRRANQGQSRNGHHARGVRHEEMRQDGSQ